MNILSVLAMIVINGFIIGGFVYFLIVAMRRKD